jgi:hypothetical protein
MLNALAAQFQQLNALLMLFNQYGKEFIVRFGINPIKR